MQPDPHDLRAFRGADFKTPTTGGGIGKPKAKAKVSQEFIDAKNEKRARKQKCGSCRTCPNVNGYRIEPHHIVRRGTPHFGEWLPENILGLCLECHTKYHSGDETTRKAIRLALTADEIAYSEARAFEGFVDDTYWPLPKSHGRSQAAGLDVAALGRPFSVSWEET